MSGPCTAARAAGRGLPVVTYTMSLMSWLFPTPSRNLAVDFPVPIWPIMNLTPTKSGGREPDGPYISKWKWKDGYTHSHEGTRPVAAWYRIP